MGYNNCVVNDSPCEAREPNIREKLDKIYDIISNCYEITDMLDTRLYSPRPIAVTEGENGNMQSVDDKLQVIFSKATNMLDNLKYINNRL